ncbi:MAG: DUF6519 domain-containing protein [Terracidiphilus sp.]|jgi:hypothetical protein
MSFDNSRYNYDHWKLYAGVVSEQGRVQTDSDWNEWLAGLTRRIDAGSFDTFGHAVYPQTTPNAFEINASSSSGNDILIGLGRMYVDGILVENLGIEKGAGWDSALAEASNTPQPQPSTPQPLILDGNSIDYTGQPLNNAQSVPTTAGAYMAYLDVWRRPITYIEDSNLIDTAIGVDTTGRMQTAWRVNLMPLPVVTIPQSALTGTFNDGDLVTQDSGATGIVIGGLSGSGPLLLSQLTGTPNGTDAWTNTSVGGDGSFTPSGPPVIEYSFIAGAVQSGSKTFSDTEPLLQNGTGATAVLVSVAAGGPMIVSTISGTPSPLAYWVGQTSGGVFQPASLPSALSNSIPGSTTGTLIPGEEVIQDHSHASAIVIGPVPQTGPMIVGLITGTPDTSNNNYNWVGQSSSVAFTPTAVPSPFAWSGCVADYSIPWPVSSGQLATQPVSTPKTGPCCMTAGVGYTGAENQLYRVEIHTPGGPGGTGATFKWSRENASVQTAVTAIGMAATNAGPNGASLTVQSLGKDQVLGFQNGNWIEITDAWHDNAGLPGELYKIDHVDIPTSSVILTSLLSVNFSSTTLANANNPYTRIIRWDQAGVVDQVGSSGQVQLVDLDGTDSAGALNGTFGIPIPSGASANTPVVLENGVAVTFNLSLSNGNFLPMDFWTFTARASDGTIGQPISPAPQGIAHHFTNLGTVTFTSTSGSASDCRQPWPPTSGSGECGCCCTVTVGDNKTSFGKFTSIQKAIDSLAHGGDVSILCGDFYEDILIKDKANITIHGCGEKTRVLSPSLQKGGGTTSESGSTAIDVPAVFSITRSANISISSLTIDADDESIGVLLDRPASTGTGKQNIYGISDKQVTLSDLKFKSQGMPAITALAADSLFIRENTIKMADSGNLYPAVYLSGKHLWFERNIVEITSGRLLRVAEELDINKAGSSGTAKNAAAATSGSGGVQVGGPSRDVWIAENQITGGNRNGITLGNLIALDANGDDTGEYLAMIVTKDEACAGGGSNSIPPAPPPPPGGTGNYTLAAGGMIHNLHILRNRIADTGMCGIGPVGFFNLNAISEVVSLDNVLIAENLILNTLTRSVLAADTAYSPYGYGAISLPDVVNLIVRDNIVNNYGVRPGAEVCGIYVYHGQVVEISRNQIRESRDLNSTRGVEWSSYGGRRAGIYIENVTPPQLDTSSDSGWLKAFKLNIDESGSDSSSSDYPLYISGIPALRIVDNTVRVAFGLALYVSGVGPFSILGNHFATGGAVTYSGDIDREEFLTSSAFNESLSFTPLTVMIFDRGCAIELGDVLSDLIQQYGSAIENEYPSAASILTGLEEVLTNSNGTVLFENNICQLSADVNRVQGGVSVVVLSLDHINFNGNELWINGGRRTALLDVAMAAITLQTTSNRFQEAINSVKYSGLTFGVANTTANNIATYCLFPISLVPLWWKYLGNTILNPKLCTPKKAG